jgi:hypothetical protein
MMTLAELHALHPDFPIVFHCIVCGKGVDRRRAWSSEDDSESILLKGKRLIEAGSGEEAKAKRGLSRGMPIFVDRYFGSQRYEWICPDGHPIERRVNQLGQIEAFLSKDIIHAYA